MGDTIDSGLYLLDDALTALVTLQVNALRPAFSALRQSHQTRSMADIYASRFGVIFPLHLPGRDSKRTAGLLAKPACVAVPPSSYEHRLAIDFQLQQPLKARFGVCV